MASGFDMIWIVVARVGAGLCQTVPTRTSSFIYKEVGHSRGEGFHVFDGIYPLFFS